MTNVVAISEKDDKLPCQEAVDAFNRLYEGYLRARADYYRVDQADDEISAAGERLGESVWSIVKAAAIQRYHVVWKLEVLRDVLENAEPVWRDRRERALLESIRADAEAM